MSLCSSRHSKSVMLETIVFALLFYRNLYERILFFTVMHDYDKK